MKLIIKYIIRGYAKLVTVSYFQQMLPRAILLRLRHWQTKGRTGKNIIHQRQL